MNTDYDVIVAGGGLTGTVAAQAISYYSNQNLSILSIDRNPETLPGRKSNPGWTCGDACSKEAVDFMTERIKVPWTSPEIEHDVKGVMAFSPDKETAIPLMVMATCSIVKNYQKFKTQEQKRWELTLILKLISQV